MGFQNHLEGEVWKGSSFVYLLESCPQKWSLDGKELQTQMKFFIKKKKKSVILVIVLLVDRLIYCFNACVGELLAHTVGLMLRI